MPRPRYEPTEPDPGKYKPTLLELRTKAEYCLAAADADRMEELAVRLIQIQEAQKELEAEKGYTDAQGVRHPGLSDELEDLLVAHRLPGLRIEDFILYQSAGSTSRIDANLILADGHGPDEIKRWTATTNWTAVVARRVGGKGG